PSFKAAFSLELVYLFEDFHKSSYQDVLSFRRIAHVPMAKGVHFRRIQVIQLPLGAAVASTAALYQIVFSLSVNFYTHLMCHIPKMQLYGQGLLGWWDFFKIERI